MQKMGPKVWRGIWFRQEAHLRDSPCWVRVSKRGFKNQPGGRFYCMSSLVRPKAMGSLHRTLTRTLSDTLSCIINVAEFSPKKNTPKDVSHRHDGVLDGNAIREIALLLAGLAFQKQGQEMIRPPSKCGELRIFLAEFPEGIRVCRAGQLRRDGLLHAQTFLLLAQGLLLHYQALLRHRSLGLDELLLHFAHRVQWRSGGFLHQGSQ